MRDPLLLVPVGLIMFCGLLLWWLISWGNGIDAQFRSDCQRLGGHTYQANGWHDETAALLCLTSDGRILEAHAQ